MEHLHLSRYSSEQLYARGRKLRHMANSTKHEVSRQSLQVLAARFEKAAARGVAKQEAVYPPCPAMLAGEDFAEAWQMACRDIGEHYMYPTTLHHPEVMGECYQLACMLVAYGMTEPQNKLTDAQTTMPKAVPTDSTDDHRVLVVDDVTDVLVSVGAFLVNAGFAVIKANNGDEAIRIIANDPNINILVTDFAMPGLNGVDLIVQATNIRPSLKAVVITGYPNADGLLDLPAGIAVLTKPFRRDALVAAVKSLFASYSGEHQTARVPDTVT